MFFGGLLDILVADGGDEVSIGVVFRLFIHGGWVEEAFGGLFLTQGGVDPELLLFLMKELIGLSAYFRPQSYFISRARWFIYAFSFHSILHGLPLPDILFCHPYYPNYNIHTTSQTL